jgi:CHAD domain-containing protein
MKPTEVPGLGAHQRVAKMARQIAGARLADVRAFEDAIVEEREAEVVHDMRVATRRLRAAIELLYGKALDASGVRALADALGEVRDRQVQAAWLHEVAPKLAGEVEKQLPAAERALLVGLHEWLARAVPRLVLGMARLEPKGRLFGHRIRRRLQRRARAVRHALAAVDPADLASEPAHALRIALKKLRYGLELVVPSAGRWARRAVDVIEPVQEGLGEVHDADVRLALLAELSAPRAVVARVAAERAVYAEALAAELTRWRVERIAEKLLRA